jgi:hypothetical protein
MLLGDWEPPALRSACPVMLGHVHGDANSRNFLFDGNNPAVRTLQIVDTGGYQPEALRVFDLAQLEADLKMHLMGTETACGGYLDIDSTRLAHWKKEEKRSIREGLIYRAPEASERPEIARAYKIVERIRAQADTVSLEERGERGRAYFFCLLYWTLRKTRHAGVLPETKRLLAFYSAHLILQKLATLQHP